MTLEKLLEELKNLTYEDEGYNGRKYSYHIINQKYFPQVEMAIRQYILNNYNAEMGELKAKCYTYEKMIANSNFAPILQKEQQEQQEQPKIGHWIKNNEYGFTECSECHSNPLDFVDTVDENDNAYIYTLMPYCPNCGIRMKSEE